MTASACVCTLQADPHNSRFTMELLEGTGKVAHCGLGEVLLNALNVALMLFDAQAHCIFLNAEAGRALSGGLPLQVRRGRISGKNPDTVAAVTNAIRRCAAGEPQKRSFRLRLPTPAGRGAVLSLTQVQIPRDDGGNASAVLAILHHARAREPLDPFELEASYGLTPAEARVAAAIAEGKIPKVIAMEFGVTLHTVRSQLQAIYSKVGARNSNELIVLLHWEHCHTYW